MIRRWWPAVVAVAVVVGLVVCFPQPAQRPHVGSIGTASTTKPIVVSIAPDGTRAP